MKRLIAIAGLGLLSACASVTTGSTQSVMVTTTPAGAECVLNNDKGSWVAKSTPDSVMISRSYSPLSVVCEKGKLRGIATVQSGTKGMVFGNVIAGGIIGAAVDMSSGAAYDYPPSINVVLGR
jgi:hypothetical protein